MGPVTDTTSWLVECSSDDRDQQQVSESTIVGRHVTRARPANLPDVACFISSHDRASSEPDDWYILRSDERISLKIIKSSVRLRYIAVCDEKARCARLVTCGFVESAARKPPHTERFWQICTPCHHQPPSLFPSVHNEKSKVQPSIERRRDSGTSRKEAKKYMVEQLMPKGRTKSEHGGHPLQICMVWLKGSRVVFLYNPREESKDK